MTEVQRGVLKNSAPLGEDIEEEEPPGAPSLLPPPLTPATQTVGFDEPMSVSVWRSRRGLDSTVGTHVATRKWRAHAEGNLPSVCSPLELAL